MQNQPLTNLESQLPKKDLSRVKPTVTIHTFMLTLSLMLLLALALALVFGLDYFNHFAHFL